PVLPNAADAERFTGLHRNGIRLLGLLSLNRLPLEKAVHRHDAAPLAVGVPERREPVNGLALGVDWLAASGWVLAPIRNQAPAQWIDREFAGRVIPPDDPQLLARGGIPAWRIVVYVAVANIEAIYDGIPKRSAALDDSPAHALMDVSPQACSSTSGTSTTSRRVGQRRLKGGPRHTPEVQ